MDEKVVYYYFKEKSNQMGLICGTELEGFHLLYDSC